MNWYKNKGNEGDIVLSTRVRLARNLTEYPFPIRLDEAQRRDIGNTVKEILDTDKTLKLNFIDMSSLSSAETVSLAEKHLISPEFACDTLGRSLLLSDDEDISIMICEEDHIRIQTVYPGLSLEEAFETALKIDEILENKLSYAFDENLGYLTQCPTNIGTALRASVMLHLPALNKKGAMQRLSTTVAKLGLTLRGSYGEGSEVSGDIYQLSNQVTLGISEEAAIKNLNSIAMQIIAQEKQARALLIKDEDYLDRIYRAYGILKSAYKLTSKELINLISYVRVGVSEGILDIPAEKLRELTVLLQPATLNAHSGKILTQTERDILRSQKVREELA
ncbi:MAG: protein arginine kinase [Clostridia bacterium]|nr:protein arginine kinase [Clostridia bacterium]MBO7319526.1 protein arginine kinase [Clostridia bacterium]